MMDGPIIVVVIVVIINARLITNNRPNVIERLMIVAEKMLNTLRSVR